MEYIEGLISIVTPAYNAEKFIKETVNSVIDQTYTKWEMIIVNDGSVDSTQEIITSFNDKRIRFINLSENQGAANAWNIAFEKAKGEYIAFLDADDLWCNDKLMVQLQFMKENGYEFTYTSFDWIDEDSKLIGKKIKVQKSKSFSRALMNTNIGALTVMLDRKIFDDLQTKDAKNFWDYYLWGSLLKKGYTAYGIQKVLAHYRIVSTSNSRNKVEQAKGVWHAYRHDLNVPLLKCIIFYAFYAFNNVKKYYFGKK